MGPLKQITKLPFAWYACDLHETDKCILTLLFAFPLETLMNK